MGKLEDSVLGFKKIQDGTREVRLSEYFKENYDLSLKDLSNLSERDLLHLHLRLSMEQSKFMDYAISNNYWRNEPSANMIYSAHGKIIKTNLSHVDQDKFVENQLDSHYMEKCPGEWLDNCLAYNAKNKIIELRKVVDSKSA
jgi:hypothetical protein